MKALSIQQPWASLILGIAPEITIASYYTQPKDVENRTWTTQYRGELLVHAGKKIDREWLEFFFSDYERGDIWTYRHHCFPTGAILGIVTLTVIIQDSDSIWANCDCFHWLLSNPRVLTDPVPYKGQLGLFNVPLDIAEMNFEETR